LISAPNEVYIQPVGQSNIFIKMKFAASGLGGSSFKLAEERA
jgi:hypothetical protein